MQRFTELKVWQRSHQLTLAVYRATRKFPADERFGLTSQLRRSAASVAANIAEGSKRKQPNDYARFLNLAEGSLAEAEYFMMLSRDLEWLPKGEAQTFLKEAEEIARMLNALRSRVESAAPRSKQTLNSRLSTVDQPSKASQRRQESSNA